ncbi:MAG: helix-turn-helix domain-containing protein, partial [Actinomycetota bacterium]|nr:helix-turn-helix domain-containing protein [Actinomycetota bacterium]
GYVARVVDWVLVSRVRKAFATGEAERLRLEAGLSQRELARAAGLPASSVQRWEAGDSVPRPDACEAWAKAIKRLGLHLP